MVAALDLSIPSHPPSRALRSLRRCRPKPSFRFQTQSRNDISKLDKAIVLARFLRAQLTIIGFARQQIEPRLRIAGKLQLTKRPNAFFIQTPRRRFQQTVIDAQFGQPLWHALKLINSPHRCKFPVTARARLARGVHT